MKNISSEIEELDNNIITSVEYKLSIKIMYYCNNLPSENLKKHIITDDLAIEWLKHKISANLLGRCLQAHFGFGGGNPAKRALNNGSIDYLTYELVSYTVDYYVSLFHLFQTAWEDIHDSYLKWLFSLPAEKQALFDFIRPKNEIDLFLICLINRENKKFLQTVYNVEISVKTLNDLSILLNKVYRNKHTLNSKELSAFHKLTSKFNPYKNEDSIDFETFALKVCMYAAKTDTIIAKDLNRLYEAIASLSSTIRQACEKERETPNLNRVVGTQWKKGVCSNILKNNKKENKYS